MMDSDKKILTGIHANHRVRLKSMSITSRYGSLLTMLSLTCHHNTCLMKGALTSPKVVSNEAKVARWKRAIYYKTAC